MLIPSLIPHPSQQIFKDRSAWEAAKHGSIEMFLAISNLKQNICWEPSQWPHTGKQDWGSEDPRLCYLQALQYDTKEVIDF